MIDYVFNTHRNEWTCEGSIGGKPDFPGPVELYRPLEDGTEELSEDANIEVEFYGDYDTLECAIASMDCLGRWLISRREEGRYLGSLNVLRGSVGLTIF